MDNKKRGPVTVPGKNNSSKNALRHGATAKRFINDQEKDRFEALLTSLNNHYQSNNPLIGLQLERIARVTIQLERIQNTIDALFEKSRAQSSLENNLMDALDIGTEQRLDMLLKSAGIPNAQEFTEKLLWDEVITCKLIPPKSQEEFLSMAPTLCARLYQEACQERKTIEAYIQKEMKLINPNRNQVPHFTVTFDDSLESETELTNLTLEEAILSTDLNDIESAISLKLRDIQVKATEKRKLEDFDKLLPIEEQATMPDLDQLDRLMRYQTTLQRQLSTTVGELIALTKANSV